jgi:hypothetical protein
MKLNQTSFLLPIQSFRRRYIEMRLLWTYDSSIDWMILATVNEFINILPWPLDNESCYKYRMRLQTATAHSVVATSDSDTCHMTGNALTSFSPRVSNKLCKDRWKVTWSQAFQQKESLFEIDRFVVHGVSLCHSWEFDGSTQWWIPRSPITVTAHMQHVYFTLYCARNSSFSYTCTVHRPPGQSTSAFKCTTIIIL